MITLLDYINFVHVSIWRQDHWQEGRVWGYNAAGAFYPWPLLVRGQIHYQKIEIL